MSLTSSLKEIILALVLDTNYEAYLGQRSIPEWEFVNMHKLFVQPIWHDIFLFHKDAIAYTTLPKIRFIVSI